MPGESGGRETYARELALALRSARPDIEFVSFINRETAGADGFWRDIGRVVRLPISPRARPAWAWAELVGVPVASGRASVDVLHSPANFGPLAGPFARVLTLHDVLFKSHPELLTPAMLAGTRAMLPPAARRAHRLITVSDASREEIVRRLGIADDRIAVVPNGWTPPAAPGDPQAARRLAGAGERVIALCVASDLPHKNLPMLLEALSLIGPPQRPLLVLTGQGTDSGELPAHAADLGLSDDVRTLGSVPPRTLENLYAAAGAVITPTRLEGFGLPVLEALGRGVPVACSDLPVLRELAGDAATYFDASEPRAAAEALLRVLDGGPDALRMREAGRERAGRFTWDAAAHATAHVYERALHSVRKRR